jgi:microcystin-dependent protein
MAWKALIDGAYDHGYIDQTKGVYIDLRFNERGRARFTTLASYCPSTHDEVLLYEQDGTTVLFGGVVTRLSHRGIASLEGTDVECSDYSVYADWVHATLSYATAHTLADVLWDLALILAPYDIELDPGQVTGPTLEPFAWENRRVSDALRDLTAWTGYVWSISPGQKYLSMVVPGTAAAPWNISDAAPHCRDLSWVESDGAYANKIRLTCGDDQARAQSESWTTDGVATYWEVSLPATLPHPRICRIDGALHTIDVGGAPEFTWDWALGRLSLGSLAQPGAGHTLTLDYTAQYPFTITLDNGGSPVVEYVTREEGILTRAKGNERINVLLDKMSARPKTVTIHEADAGLAPGDSLTINLTLRSLNITAFISALSVQLVSDTFWRYTATAVQGTLYPGGDLDLFRSLTSGAANRTVVNAGNTVFNGVVAGEVAGDVGAAAPGDVLGGAITATSVTSTGALGLKVLTDTKYVTLGTDAINALLQSWSLMPLYINKEGNPVVFGGAVTFLAGATGAEPAGIIHGYGGATAPTGYLLCDGASYLRADYAALFTAIGTTWGSADGTHFNVPDGRGKTLLGKAAAGTGSTLGASLGALDHVHAGPSHTHTISGTAASDGPGNHVHAFSDTSSGPSATSEGGSGGAQAGDSTHTHDVSGDTGNNSASLAHTHGAGSLAADAAGTGNTAASNGPVFVGNWIIKT